MNDENVTPDEQAPVDEQVQDAPETPDGDVETQDDQADAPDAGDGDQEPGDDEPDDGVETEPAPARREVPFYGMMAKRGARAASRARRERGAAVAKAIEAGYDEADLIDSDGNPLDAAGILASLEVEPGFIETIPGTEDQEPIEIEAVPLEDGEAGTPAVVTDADGNVIEPGEDGLPVLTDDSGTPAEPEPQEASEEATDEPEPVDDTPADEGYDPGAHTVAEVQTYLGENPDQSEYVLDRERAGKARVTLLGA